jgi:lipoate-protein ligase A
VCKRGIRLHRRQSGGRVVPFGDGYVGVALVLPHRAALLSNDPFTLAPYQVLNRYVRGILEGCKLVGLPAFYPGRDFITTNGRILGVVSFELDDTGALLFEAIIANARDFSALPRILDVVDPSGIIKAEMPAPQRMTCLAAELGTQLSTEEVAELLRRGFEKQFNVALGAHTLTPLERQAIDLTAAHEFVDDRWLFQRQVTPELDHYVFERVQLGMFEAYFSLEQERFIKEIVFAGDFIANSAAVARLERDLRLCPREWRAIDAVASSVFADPQNFVLGIGQARAIADIVCKGMPA